MNLDKKNLLLLFPLALFFALYAPLKTNLSGSSYTRAQNNKTGTNKERKPWVSVYKSLLSEGSTEVISLFFQYIIPTDLLRINLGSGSTFTQGNAMATLSAGTDLTVSSTVSSRKSISYSPGHEIVTFFTASFPTPTASGGHTTRWIGLFTATDGMAVGFQNSTFGILHMKNGVSTFIPQNSFNLDTLDGKGESKFTIDPTKINIFYIAFGWLGAAPLEFGIATEEGDFVCFHKIRYPNLFTTPSVFNPSLPLSLAVSKNGSDSGDLQIGTVSWNAKIVGEEHKTRIFSAQVPSKTLSGTTYTPIVSLRNRTTYAGKTSTARMRLLYMNAAGYTAGNQLRISIYKEPTLFNSSFENVDTTLSVIQRDTSATSFTSTGTLIFQTSIYSQGSTNIFFKSNGIDIELFPGETLSIAGSEAGSGSLTMDTSLTWEEFQ